MHPTTNTVNSANANETRIFMRLHMVVMNIMQPPPDAKYVSNVPKRLQMLQLSGLHNNICAEYSSSTTEQSSNHDHAPSRRLAMTSMTCFDLRCNCPRIYSITSLTAATVLIDIRDVLVKNFHLSRQVLALL